jgi:hypothetical protein
MFAFYQTLLALMQILVGCRFASDAVLDANITSTHANHLIFRVFIQECSPCARFGAAVQDVCDCVAQTLVFRFEEQIRQLVPDSAHVLSEYAARAMAAFIKRDSVDKHKSLAAFFVASVQDDSVLSMKSGRGLHVKKQKLITIRGVGVDTWNAVCLLIAPSGEMY